MTTDEIYAAAAASEATHHTVGCTCQRCDDIRAVAPLLIAQGRQDAAQAIRAYVLATSPALARAEGAGMKIAMEQAARIAEGGAP